MDFFKAGHESILSPDYVSESRDIDLKLLRALALGNKHSNEIQLMLAEQIQTKSDFQELTFKLTNQSVENEKAYITFKRLLVHKDRIEARLGRQIGLKPAALDYVENIERALGIPCETLSFTVEQLTQMAFTDHLTGLSNYRYFMMRFKDEIKRAARYSRLCSLLMLDFDYFKMFNDTCGHPIGNQALEELSRRFVSLVRETDFIGRYGGEEFVFVLPETPKKDALNIAEQIREEVGVKPVCGDRNITVSLGVATFPRDADSASFLLDAADKALYQSKMNGRNRVTGYKPVTSAIVRYDPNEKKNVKSVHVVGDFNGWLRENDVMSKEKDGSFMLTLDLVPGTYKYKFCVNNGGYIADPDCICSENDGFGGRNSILVVKDF
jgi:diguanylate cyclase (GGDEF)-like protein